MKKIRIAFLVLLLTGFGVSGASATIFNVFEYKSNMDGTIVHYYPPSPNPPTLDLPFDIDTSITPVSWPAIAITFTGTGAHNSLFYFDIEIDELANTFFNEYAGTGGARAAGQSWEIDEPGYVFGDIYTNFTNGTLDNGNGVPSTAPDDVAMALGWNFILAAGETATVVYRLSDTAPTSSFYLKQTDPDSQADIYFYSTLDIRGGGEPIPEPGTLMLLGSGLLGLIGLGRKKLMR
jgi:hypothetical protein